MHDPTLTKDQRYYRRHKQEKEKKPRVYHFQKYWAEEWEKAVSSREKGLEGGRVEKKAEKTECKKDHQVSHTKAY